MSYRFLKQLVYIFIYCAIFFLLGWGGYKLFYVEPTCFDGKQNQNEAGIDCGGPCFPCAITGVADPEVLWKKILPATAKAGNLIIAIKNTTGKYGADNIEYAIRLVGADGRSLKEFSGKSFILPSQIKYIVIPNIDILARDVLDIQFSISKISWKTINVDNSLLGHRMVSGRFSAGADLGYITIGGHVINRTAIILDNISVYAVVYNKNNPPEPVAVGSTNVYTVLPNEERFFQINIPGPIFGVKKEDIDLENIDILPDANLFLYY